MSKFLARRELGKLVPVDQAGEDALRKLRFGTFVTVEIKQPRNGRHHALYWVLVSEVFKHQSQYETVDQLHDALKLAAGIYTQLKMPSGVVYKIPGTIAFSDMDQTSFAEFYDRICDLVAEHFLPGVNIPELKATVESMIGIRAA